MILRRSRSFAPRLVASAALALALPCAGAVAQYAPVPPGTPASERPATAAPAAAPSPGVAAPEQPETENLRQRDKELDAVRADERASAENQAKLRREIETIGEDRPTLNQHLIDTAGRVRDVEGRIDETRTRLRPLDAQEAALRTVTRSARSPERASA